MANHKSSVKRIRQTEKRALHNHYYAKTMRNAVRKDAGQVGKDQHHPQEQGRQPEVKPCTAHQQVGIIDIQHSFDRSPSGLRLFFCSFLADKLCLSEIFLVPLPKICEQQQK